MSLIYVTGNSGVGKSSVRKELQKLGYEAHDTDEDGITSWRHKTTGELADRPTEERDRTNAWYEHHEWIMSRERVQELADRAINKTIFLCGAVSNTDEVLDLFGEVIYLAVDGDTLRKRLTTRTTNDFGKAPDELTNILGWHDWLEEQYKDRGAMMVDATRPLSDVVDDIIGSLS